MERLKELHYWIMTAAAVLVGLMAEGKIPSGKWAAGVGVAIVALKIFGTELARRWQPKDEPLPLPPPPKAGE